MQNEISSKCPVCEMRRARVLRQAVAETAAAYGKLSRSIFLKLVEKEEKAKQELAVGNLTLREFPKKLQLEDGILMISYYAKCYVCGLAIEHDEEVKIAAVEKENYE